MDTPALSVGIFSDQLEAKARIDAMNARNDTARLAAPAKAALIQQTDPFFLRRQIRDDQIRDSPFSKLNSTLQSCFVMSLRQTDGKTLDNFGLAGKYAPGSSQLLASLFIVNSGIPGNRLQPATKNNDTVPTILIGMTEDCIEFEVDDSPPEALVKKYSNKPTEPHCIVRVKLVQGRTPVLKSGHLGNAVQNVIDAFQILSTLNKIQFLVQGRSLQTRQWMMTL